MDAEHQNDVAYDVFISHRSLYKPWVETLARNLCKWGYKVWLDTWELVPGRNFAPGLQRGLDLARKGILVATPDAVESGWVREEYEAMLSRKQRDSGFSIVPLVFGEFPDLPFLANVHCVDFRDPSPVASGLAQAEPSLPPLVPEGEKFSDVEKLLASISRNSPINTIAFSPDGTALAAGFEDGSVRL